MVGAELVHADVESKPGRRTAPLKVPSAVWKLCLRAIGVGILFTVADALLR